ncbi:MAG: sensor histidine kinase, partial [Bdellovibrionales bacterium]|nr:sensor histidine kinase [Massilia sp.]
MMAAGILIPVILFSGLALSMLRQSEKDAALDALNQTANSLAQRVDRELYSAEAALKVLAASPALARQDYRAFYKEAAVTNRGDNGWHVLLDEHGRQLINTSVAYGSQLPETYSLAEVRALAAKGATSVSDVTRGPMTGKRVTRVVLPIVTAGERKLLLTQTFSTDHFVQLVQNIRMPSGWLVAIIDGQGRFVARNLNAGKLVGTPARPELVAAMGISRSGRIRHSTIENTEVYDVFTHSSLCGWAFAVAAPVELIDYAARRASLVAAAGLLAATFGAIGLAAFFGGLHMRSMRAAVKAAIELGNGIPPGRVHSQVLEVNELHAALHAAGEQLVQAQAYRKHAETERECLLESEQRARLMAEQQNSAKDQFLAMLGHELRNPLAPISTAAQLLKLQSTDPNRVRYASDVITRQVDHMNSLLGDMLDVSRVTRGLVSLSLAQVNLKAIIERALEQTAGMIDVKQHALSVSFPDGELLVKGDQTRLIQIFANLINNAAKYTAPGGHIEVAASIFAGTVEVSVRDNGEGFSPDLAVRIFDLFSQGERQPDRSQGGLGLGLALVKSLVKLHGGTVEANSAGAGCGSEFVVTLPRAAGHQPSPA